jgi:tetratricopeptide (TPR) repeat protein
VSCNRASRLNTSSAGQRRKEMQALSALESIGLCSFWWPGKRMRPVVMTAVIAIAVLAGRAPAWSSSLARVDARAEVTAALYASSATAAAAERQSDAKLRLQRVQIASLAVRVREGNATRIELVNAEEQLVAQLAAKDRAYAEEIAVYRGAVEDIAKTPEGAQALAQFNNGDEVGAIAILDRLRAARDAARDRGAKIASAAEGERIALLASEANGRGKLKSDAVVARFEEVTQLDPGLKSAWIRLAGLYLDVGRVKAAESALDQAGRPPIEDREAAAVSDLRGVVFERENDYTDAARAFGESIRARRHLVSLPGASPYQRLVLVDSLLRLSGVLYESNDSTKAMSLVDEAIGIARGVYADKPTNVLTLEEISRAIGSRGVILSSLGDLEGASKATEEALAIDRAVYKYDPESLNKSSVVASDINNAAMYQLARGHFQEALNTFAQSESLFQKTIDKDSKFQGPNRGIAYDNLSMGLIYQANGDLSKASSLYKDSATTFFKFVSTDSKNSFDQIRLAEALFCLSTIPNSGVTFSKLLPLVTQVERRGLADPEQREMIKVLHHLVEDKRGIVTDPIEWPGIFQQMGDAAASGGDRIVAAELYQVALHGARRMMAGNPQPALERVAALCLSRLAEMRGSGVSWSDAATQWEALKKEGRIDSADEAMLGQADHNAQVSATTAKTTP